MEKRKYYVVGFVLLIVAIFAYLWWRQLPNEFPRGDKQQITSVSVTIWKDGMIKEGYLWRDEIPSEVFDEMLEVVHKYRWKSGRVDKSGIPPAEPPYTWMYLNVIGPEQEDFLVFLSSEPVVSTVRFGNEKHYDIVDADKMYEEINALLEPYYDQLEVLTSW